MESELMLTPRETSPLSEGSQEGWPCDAASRRTVQHTTDWASEDPEKGMEKEGWDVEDKGHEQE